MPGREDRDFRHSFLGYAARFVIRLSIPHTSLPIEVMLLNPDNRLWLFVFAETLPTINESSCATAGRNRFNRFGTVFIYKNLT